MVVKAMKVKKVTDSIQSEFVEKFGKRIKINHSLANYCTFGTGGEARLFAKIKSAEELIELIKFANDAGVEIFMLGGGSNMLISDSGFDGLILRNSIMGIELEGDNIVCGAGEDLQTLVDFAADNCLSGLEFASGIYGTVGGAVFGNAGAYGSQTGSVLEWAELVDKQGRIRIEQAEYFEFAYRWSKLKITREYITRAKFALKQGKKEAIKDKISEILAQRECKLPNNKMTAGCFFKNIPDPDQPFGKLSAGKLLDEIGAKSLRVGGAKVFDKHANIIINDGTANTTDIRLLADRLKKLVHKKFGLELEEEITPLGKF
jgi:UDP-N-acetylmuramate dehydrogenase